MIVSEVGIFVANFSVFACIVIDLFACSDSSDSMFGGCLLPPRYSVLETLLHIFSLSLTCFSVGTRRAK